MRLKSTGEQVISLPYVGVGHQPWPVDYKRVLIQGRRKNGQGVVEIVHKSKIDDLE